MSSAEASADFVTALARGLEVIRAFSSTRPEMTLSEIAGLTGLSPATVRRSLLTLLALGYVKQNGRRFVLTSRVLQLAAAFVESMNLKEVAQVYLQELADAFHDAASLTILDGRDVVYIAHVPTQRPVQLRQYVGARMPAHAASTGYAMLAHMDPARLEAYLAQAPFEVFTPRTPSSAAELRAILEQVRRDGYAVAHDAIAFGTIAVAVPIQDAEGRVIAAINCSADSTRVDRETLVATRLPPMRRAAQQINRALVQYPALARSVQP
ncbi:IclR family transcriptional regulator C-terminal domain-containing protein [Orrella sp. JC864]|uniref:IclR family transcriptional regulator n=1 Tax=Orrella sp. JC864 TaxID=3120298 RepID=UPI0012BD40BD